jgi:O-antigen/teichoic acid export membrane protein
MKQTSIKKNLVLSTLYQILTLIIPFITAPYISRVIGATGVGIYSYTVSIQTYFSMFAALGTVSYGARAIARVRNDEKKRSKLFWEIEILTIITSCICLVAWAILIVFSKEYKIYYLILTLNLFNTMFDISWFYTGLEQLKYTVIQNSIFKILGVILLLLCVKSPNDLALYMGIMTLTTLLGTMSMWIYLPKFLKKVKLKEIKIFYHFKETLIYFVPTIATSIYTVLDKTLIGMITSDASENGYYEQATKIINMAKTLTFTALNTVLGSRISYLFAEEKYDEIHKRIDTSMNYILFMGFAIMFGLFAVSDRFVPLFFGQGYEKVILLIKILSPLVIIIGISNCLGSQYYNPAGLRSKSAKFIIIGSITNLILNLILIPKLWSYGATIATIIAETIISLLYLKYCDGYLTLKKLIKFSWKKLLSAIIMFLCIFKLKYWNYSDLIVISTQFILGAIIYLISLICLKDEFVINIYNTQIKSKIFMKKEETKNEN